MSMYFFYILRCADNSLYSGITTDLERRLKEHNGERAKGAKYTQGRGPVMLVYQKKYKTRSLAMKREIEVKGWTKGAKESFLQNNKAKH